MNEGANSDISRLILRDMQEGVIVIETGGKITLINGSAEKLLRINAEEMIGTNFASSFFDTEYADVNSVFLDGVIDAIFDPENVHEVLTEYNNGQDVLKLHVKTSSLTHDGKVVGIIVVMSDMSELLSVKKTFGRFLSEDIVEQLLTTPTGLKMGGNKKSVTVLMSDLCGFTAMSEHMDADDLIISLNHYLEKMTEIIQKYRGTIIEFLGDGILAIFGAPKPNENHAADAVAAAIEMQAAMREINEWNREKGYMLFHMGIGINSGETIVGNIGSEMRTKYGVMGATVNLSGRIESYASGEQIYISPYTREMISSDLTVVEELEVFPKGVPTPIIISRVEGMGEPYNIECNYVHTDLIKLENPFDLNFQIIREKHIFGEILRGRVLELSTESVRIEVDAEVKAYDDVQIDIGDKLYGKVKAVEDGEALITFTSCPESFENWLNLYINN